VYHRCTTGGGIPLIRGKYPLTLLAKCRESDAALIWPHIWKGFELFPDPKNNHHNIIITLPVSFWVL